MTSPEIKADAQKQAAAREEVEQQSSARDLSGVWRAIFATMTFLSVILAVNQLFNLRFFVGVVLLETSYLFLVASIFLALTFLLFPLSARAGSAQGKGGRVPFYDVILAATALGIGSVFAYLGPRMVLQGWEFAAPDYAFWLALIFYLLVLEGTRRAGGPILLAIVGFFSLYPIFANMVPGPIQGYQQPFDATVIYHIFSSESSFGIPLRAFGQLVIGFVLFGAALQYTGGGVFFTNLAFALVGNTRGGAAKVAIFASGFMGSMSGSVVSNVLSTGAVSIPAMIRTGFSRRYAAGTEACASTGGVLMPPIMGTTAFLMASFLGMPYYQIVLAAIIPSLLYYLSLFIQIDAYAAKHGLKGVPRAELPSVRQTMKEGWQYLFVLVLLIFFLVGLRQETLAPFYATAALLVINQMIPRTRLNFRGFTELVVGVGRSLVELVAILLGVGLIIGAFSVTGLAATLVNDLIGLAGGNVYALLGMGAITAFVFGMGMTVSACYVFLAIVLAPALIRVGLDPLAVHLFIMYWGMVSFITPPVALGAFAAATVAGTRPMAVGFEAMRLGSIIYIVPFFFVLHPELIGRGAPVDIAVNVVTAVLGVVLISSAFQGQLLRFGWLGEGPLSALARTLLCLAGLGLAAPADLVAGGSLPLQVALTLALGVVALLCARLARGGSPQPAL